MSNNAFRVKNSLHLTPQAVEPSGLEVGDLWMDIDGNLKRWDGSASQDVGSGGVGSVDIMFAQTLEQAVIGDFTVAGSGSASITENVLNVLQGKKTLQINHGTGLDTTVKQVIEVPNKFRNKNVTLSLDLNTTALSGNLTLTVIDETNATTLVNVESLQPQGETERSVKRSVSFNIPDLCEELSYTITAVSESGAISLIDNVVIELTQTAKLDTTIEVPVITEWQDYSLVIGATTTAPTPGTTSVNKAQWRRVGANMEIRYDYKQTGAGTTGNGNYLFPMPAGYSVDVAKIPSGSAEQNVVGIAKMANGTSPVGGTTVPGVVLLSKTYPNNFVLNYAQTSTENTTVVSSAAYPLNSATIGFSFTASVPVLGWEATETQSVSLAQTVLVQESDSAFTGLGFVGNGSTNTGVIRLSGSVSNYGDALTYTSDAVLGDSWTVNKAGIYDVHASVDTSGGAGYAYYFTKNATVLTATVASTHSITSRLSNTGYSNTSNDVTQISGSDYLEVGDVIRFHCASSGVTASNGQYDVIKISYQGKLKQLNVSENQKIEIPTSELRMEGASARGTGAETFTAKYTNIAKIRGDAFSLDNSNATIVTMKKKGRLNVSASIRTNTSAASITKNQAVNTAAPLASERMAAALVSTATAGIMSMHACFDVNIGDVIRVNAEATPTADSGNSLTLSFQEQEVAVSVTNVLPQFSESDSSVRVDTANGYGSPTGTRIRRFSNVRDNLGSAIAYNDGSLGLPATVGDYFIINESGDYDISYTDSLSVDQSYLGLSKNASSLTTNIDAIASVERLALSRTSGTIGTCAWSGYLQAGDVIRAHTEATASSNVNHATFTISKVGKPNVTGVDVTPFAKIEYEVVDSLFISGNNNGAGSTWTNFRRFTGLTSFTNRGVIRYVQDAAFGDYFEALKPCKMDISWSGPFSSGGASSIYIVKNPTTNTISSGQQIAFSDTGTNLWNTAAGSTELQVGDRIRLASVAANTFTSTSVSITATELRDAYQVIGGGVENTYSARIQNNGAASIISQSYPFIDSVSRTTTGTIQINFKAGFFTVAPTLTASALFIASDRYALVDSVSTTTAIVKTFQTSTGTSLFDVDFFITLQRQGSDYRTPSKAIGLPAQRIAYIKDVKAAGASSGTFTSGAWQTRTLNALTDPTGLVTSLASNQFVLPAGVYDIEASAPAYKVGRHKAKIRNITDSLDVLSGEGSYTDATDNTQTTAIVSGRISITSNKTFELQHRCQTSTATNGFGVESNFVVDEVYAQVKITKIEE